MIVSVRIAEGEAGVLREILRGVGAVGGRGPVVGSGAGAFGLRCERPPLSMF